ncbi:MAG TPA: DUF3108 domain-containing protein [Stellaceae bacterium]|nr:DUF3108 domain-containing protein [Stellaceae bacterium]
MAVGLALLGAVSSGPAHADESQALYQAYWAGLPAGQIRLTLREDATSYRDEIGMTTEGMARLATRFRATAVSQGRLAGATAAPAQYDAYYDLRKGKNRRLALRFAARGGAVVADRGAEDTSKKPPLAEEFRRNVLDPLSALAAIRQGLRDRTRTAFTIPVYDGARRFDVVVQVLQKKPGSDILPVELSLRPIAGFKGESSEDGDPDNAPRPVQLTLTDDARLMPLTMSVPLYYLPLTVELTQWCKPGERCGW